DVTEHLTVNYTVGTQMILSSTADGLGEMLSDGAVEITINGSTVAYSHDYYDATADAYLPTNPVDLTAYFVAGTNHIDMTISSSHAPLTWSQGYRLVQPRNPYAPVLGAEGPTLLSLGSIDAASGNYIRRENDLSVSALGLNV